MDMQPKYIRPEYKMLLMYTIRPETSDGYYRYVLGEFVPALQEKGVYMHMAWQIAYGDYPDRRIEFVTESRDSLKKLLQSDEWLDMEARLKSYTTDYSRKILRFTQRFQL